jgi:hypothetical protein
VIHSRTEFFNTEAHQRQLLRLWLSLPFGHQIGSESVSQFRIDEALSSGVSGLSFVIGLGKARMRKLISILNFTIH